MQSSETAPLVSIACGGTGGHLFPGLAVAELLLQSGCDVQLWVSSKEVDREGVGAAPGMQVVTLPAIGLQRGRLLSFLVGWWKSRQQVRSAFRRRTPAAVLAMGGFTSLAPVSAARALRIPAFLHESNSIPGRANRWLAPRVDHVFFSFPGAARRLHCRQATETGTPVRAAIRSADIAACRRSFDLNPARPVLLIAGGSQGASAINQLILSSLPLLVSRFPELQFLHLTGRGDFEQVRAKYQSLTGSAVVRPFLKEMDRALGAATAAVSRAGASSLAEFAAARLPAVLIPYPEAADNHQLFNARALVESGAALMLEQRRATPELLVADLERVLPPAARRESLRLALSRWDRPDAARQIVIRMLEAVREQGWSVNPQFDVSPGSTLAPGGIPPSRVQALAVA